MTKHNAFQEIADKINTYDKVKAVVKIHAETNQPCIEFSMLETVYELSTAIAALEKVERLDSLLKKM